MAMTTATPEGPGVVELEARVPVQVTTVEAMNPERCEFFTRTTVVEGLVQVDISVTYHRASSYALSSLH